MKRVFNVLPADLVISSPDVGAVQGLLEGVNAIFLVAKVVFEQTSTIGIEPKVFHYKIEAADGRLWQQDITFDNAVNPQMTFNVSNEWRLSEFSGQRTMRNFLISLVAKYPTLTKISYNYLAA